MDDNRVLVTILTGSLGAGKTTVLKGLIAQLGFADTAVIMNEYEYFHTVREPERIISSIFVLES